MASKEFMAKVRAWTSTESGTLLQHAKAAVVNRWLELTETLGSTLADYQAAMDVRDDGRILTLALSGEPVMAQLVEFGMLPVDLRQTLLKPSTKSIRRAKDGHLYLFVPLRKTTRTIVDLAGNRAYRMAKEMAAYEGAGSDRFPSGMADKLDPYHATDPLDGMVRIANPGGGSTYMTWRTISQNGKPWIHRGIQARHFMRQTLADAPGLVAALRR